VGSGALATVPAGQHWWRGRARPAHLDDTASITGWFPWAVSGTAALITIARDLGLTVGDRHTGERHFVELHRVR
jgi:hypothetical protein